MEKQQPESKAPTNAPRVETPEERHKRHLHRRRVAVATGFALGFLTAAGVGALVLLFWPGVVAGVGAKLAIAGIITGSGVITGLFGSKAGSNYVSDTINKENEALGLNPEQALQNLGKSAIKNIENDIDTLKDVMNGKKDNKDPKQVNKAADKVNTKDAGYTQMLEQQRANTAVTARTMQ